MRVDRSFGWLGRFPLAVDLADTVRRVGSTDVELLVDEESVSRWVEAEMSRYPVASAALGHLSEVRRLRDAVREVLSARAETRPLSPTALDLINQASKRGPSFPIATRRGSTEVVELNGDPFEVFTAAVARSTIELLDESDPNPLSLCHAPSCGMLFLAASRRQRWCSAACGNRARVARHAARSREGN